MLAEELCSERHEFCSKQKGKITFWRDVVRSDQTGEWALIGAFWCLQWVRSNPKPTQEPIECISGTSGSIGARSPSWLKNRPQYKRQLGLAKPRSRMDRKINFLDALEFIWVHQKTVTNFRQWFPAIPVALIQFQGTCASAYFMEWKNDFPWKMMISWDLMGFWCSFWSGPASPPVCICSEKTSFSWYTRSKNPQKNM